jgi:hypothetical protein
MSLLHGLPQSASVVSVVAENHEKQLQTASFVVHATRGVLRDPGARRKAMFALVIGALLLLIAGSTVLQPVLSPHEHPVWFLFFWIFCGWLALSAMLLALFDFLMLRLEARREKRMLREKLAGTQIPDSPESETGK